MSRRKTKVLLAFAWHETGHLRGISRYACEKDWQIIQSWSTTHNHMHPQLAEDLRNFQPHGILSQLQRRNADIVRVAQAARIPTVELCTSSGMAVPCVVPDESAAGALVARHLLDRGYIRFMYIGLSASEHHRGFSQAVHAAGHESHDVFTNDPKMEAEWGPIILSSLLVHDARFALPRAWARRFFAQCATPVGVLAPSIGWGTAIVEGCRHARILVPEQVALVCLADEADDGCILPMPLTVVLSDYEQQGYQAAALLDRMMRGEPVPPDTVVTIPPLGIVSRTSTLSYATTNVPIARAVTFIMNNLHDPGLCIKQIRRAAKIPHGKLYHDFSRQFNMPIARYIECLRVKEATHLLVTTDTDINVLAVQCGFGEMLRFRRAFHRVKGMAPSAWRQMHSGAKVRLATASPGQQAG